MAAGRSREPDWLAAAGLAAWLIAPAPFFWAPPFWVVVLSSR